MADYDLKTIAENTTGPSADTEVLFGAADQSTGTPKPYQFAGIKAWIKSWIVKADVGLGNVTNVKHNFAASADPVATNDTASGYSAGSLWYRTDTGDSYLCLDATTSAAVWVQHNPVGWRRSRSYGATWAQAWQGSTTTSIGPGATAIGTAAGSNSYATTNERTRRKRVPQTTGTGAGSGAGLFNNNRLMLRGSSTGRNGFRIILQFAVNTMPASWRAFVGLQGSFGAPANADPSSFLNMIGVGKDSADTAWQIMTNAGAGTATKTALDTVSFPINDTTAVFELELFCPPGGASVTYWFRRISGVDAEGNNTYAAQVTGTLSTNLPAVDIPTTWYVWINNDVNAAAAIIDTMKVYWEAFGDM